MPVGPWPALSPSDPQMLLPAKPPSGLDGRCAEPTGDQMELVVRNGRPTDLRSSPASARASPREFVTVRSPTCRRGG